MRCLLQARCSAQSLLQAQVTCNRVNLLLSLERAQVLYHNQGDLFPYGFTYLEVKLAKRIRKLGPSDKPKAAEAAAELALELEKLEIDPEDKQKTKLRKDVLASLKAQIASLVRTVPPKPPGSTGGKGSRQGASGVGYGSIMSKKVAGSGADGAKQGKKLVAGGPKGGVSKPAVQKNARVPPVRREEYWSISLVN